MGHFNYTNAQLFGEICIAVKCDICGSVLWTEITGQEFGRHIRVAREHGWEHRRDKDWIWTDMCDECSRLYREKKRREYFDVADFKEDKDEQSN